MTPENRPKTSLESLCWACWAHEPLLSNALSILGCVRLICCCMLGLYLGPCGGEVGPSLGQT